MPDVRDNAAEAGRREAEESKESVESRPETPEKTEAEKTTQELAETMHDAEETKDAVAAATREFAADPAAAAELSAIATETQGATRETKSVAAALEGNPPVEMTVAFTVLPETGLTQDYNNEFAWITGLSDMEPDEANEEYEYLAAKAAERKGGRMMREYQAVYGADQYKDVVTEKNAKGVAEINAIVKEVNDLHAAGTLTREKFLELTSKIDGIITGAAK